MAVTDIRVSITLANHPKTLDLVELCGPAAPWNLVRLWCEVAQYFPADGMMRGWTAKRIEHYAGWTGEPGAFVAAMVKVRFLDRDLSETYTCHDWMDNQRWVSGAPVRSAVAKRNIQARWEKEFATKNVAYGCDTECNTDGIPSVSVPYYGNDTERNTPLLSLPLPSVVTERERESKAEKPASPGNNTAKTDETPPEPDPMTEEMAEWVRYGGILPNEKDRKKLSAAYRTAFNGDLKAWAWGCHLFFKDETKFKFKTARVFLAYVEDLAQRGMKCAKREDRYP